MTEASCANCNAVLSGPYCAQCGQHAHISARTLHDLLHEAWHLLTHLDARLLSTLAILMRKPGQLTQQYFAGHRARYVTPFQLYFVISLAFFGLTSLSSHLHPVQVGAGPEGVGAPIVHIEITFEDCKDLADEPTWLRRLLHRTCLRQAVDNGKTLEHGFLSSIPKMMFFFLPVIAGFMMLLYLRPRRLYVEHLIFFLHAHAALYLAIILSLLIDIPTRYAPRLDIVSAILDTFLAAYGAWYIYASMRRFYAQGRIQTFSKFTVLCSVYLICLCATLLGTLILSALVV